MRDYADMSEWIGRIPLVIGTSGHRDPAEPGRVLAQVDAIFDELNRRAPQVPLSVMSPLASGGDRLVAEAALRLRARRMEAGPFAGTADGGIELVGVLPLKVVDYRLDFTTPEDLAEFDRYLAQMDHVVELPIHVGAQFKKVVRNGVEIDAVDGGEFERHRNEGFERLGRFTALHSHLLIALWNGCNTTVTGVDKRGIGGTSAVVHFCRGGNAGDKVGGVPLHDEISPILESPSTPVAFVFTARESDERKSRPRLERELEKRLGLRDSSSIEQRFVAARRWNGVPESLAHGDSADFAAFEASGSKGKASEEWRRFEALLESLKRLNAPIAGKPNEMRAALDGISREDRGLRRLVGMFERLDEIAKRDRARFERKGRLALLLLVLSILLFQVFSSWSFAVFIGAYLALLLISRKPIRAAKLLEPQRAESRTLAEIARVQIALRAAGSTRIVSDLFDERRVQAIESLAYLNRALMLPAMYKFPETLQAYGTERLRAFVESYIALQIRWRSEEGTKERKSMEEQSQRRQRLARSATIFTALFALAAAVINDAELLRDPCWSEHLEDTILPALNLAAAVSLLAVFYVETKRSLFGTKSDLERAERTLPLFERARAQIALAESRQTVEKVVERICNASIDEQLEWYITRRDGAELEALG